MLNSCRAKALAIPFLFAVSGGLLFGGSDMSSYRGFRFGMTVTEAAKQAGMKAGEAKVVHERPDLIQEMIWRPRVPLTAETAQTDPVREVLLSFFNEQLFRIVVSYDHRMIEGMSADDMIDAISLTYGAATRPDKTEIRFPSNYAEVARVVARWQDPEYSYDLVRTGDQSSFALVLYLTRLDVLAEASIARAVRLDAQEAPQREIEKQKKEDDAARLVLDHARALNRPNFQP